MQEIALIPGAGHNASSLWPIQTQADGTMYPIDYERGNFVRGRGCLEQYAERVYVELLKLGKERIDLYAWSMGAPVSLGVVKLARKTPELIRKVIMITPGVFHGAPEWNFHRHPMYTWNLLFPPTQKTLLRAQAIREIQEKIPGFEPLIKDSAEAMKESGDGNMTIPRGMDRKRIVIYYAQNDDIIPPRITKHFAQRADVKAVEIPSYGHDLPLLDTKGVVLAQIRAENP